MSGRRPDPFLAVRPEPSFARPVQEERLREGGDRRRRITNWTFVCEARGGPVAAVALDRPEILNASHALARSRLEAVIDTFAAGAAHGVAILEGAGARAFQAGDDLNTRRADGAWPRPIPACHDRDHRSIETK